MLLQLYLDLETVELKLIAGVRDTEETLASNYVGEQFPLFDASRQAATTSPIV